MIDKREMDILRELARQYAQYASLPVQDERRRLWTALNTGTPERPMVLADQLPWNELSVDGSLKCEISDPYWGELERRLRQTLYKWRNMPADMVLDPYISLCVPTIYTGWGMEIEQDTLAYEPNSDVVSHNYFNQFQSMEDLEKLQMPTIRRDREEERRVRELADVIFDGIIPYHMCGAKGEEVGLGLRLGPWDLITQWMGVTDIYIALLDDPDFMHAMVEKMVTGIEGLIDQYNREGLFDVETHMVHCSHTYADGIPAADCDHEHAQSKDAWGFGLAQLFSSVSPSVTKEFEADYMPRTFSKMGGVYYGCCERLDDRLEIVSKLPNVRKISCSPWSDREAFAEKLPAHIVMSNRPTPAVLATDSFDIEAARADVRRTIAAAKRHGKRLEMIMKDVSTVRHEPQRVWDWTKMAVEEAMRSAE